MKDTEGRESRLWVPTFMYMRSTKMFLISNQFTLVRALVGLGIAEDRQTDRQTGRQAGRQAGRQTDRQTDRQTGRQADRQTDRQTDRDRQSGRQIEI